MAANIGELRAGVVGQDGTGGRVKDASRRLSVAPAMTCDVDLAIIAAVAEYSTTRPRELAVLVSADGTFDYPVATNLPAFLDGFSTICSIVYPWVTSTYNPYQLDRDRYALARSPAGAVLRFIGLLPGIGLQFMVTHTARHTVDVGSCSTWPSDDEAIKDLAAAHCCEMLAGFYNQVVDSSIGADTVDRRSLSDMYRSEATRWRNSYALKLPKAPVRNYVPLVRG